MRKLMRKKVFMVLTGVLAVWVVAFAFSAKGYKLETRQYGAHEAQKLDIYKPETEEAKPAGGWPALVLIHGGAYMHGSRTEMTDFAKWFLMQGGVAVSIDYRLTPSGAGWEEIKSDAVQAVWWVREHAQEIGIDPENLCVLGGSAGGQLAAWLATGNDLSPKGTSSRPLCAIALAAPWDMTIEKDFSVAANDAIKTLMRGKSPAEASPIHRISDETSPILLIHGTADDVVHSNQAQIAYEALGKSKIDARILLMEGEGHGGLKSQDNAKKMIAALQEFIRDYLFQ